MSRLALHSVVGVKWVPNTSNVRFDPKTGALIREGVPSIVNPHDLDAVEFALDLRDRYGGEVTALSMAAPAAIEGLEPELERRTVPPADNETGNSDAATPLSCNVRGDPSGLNSRNVPSTEGR